MEKRTNKRKDNKRQINILRWTLVAISLFVLVIMVYNISDASDYEVYEYTEFINVTALEDDITSMEIVLEEDTDILIRSSQQMFQIKAGDEVIYDYTSLEEQAIGKCLPSRWHIVELHGISEETVITIEYYTPYTSYKDYIPTVYYGDAVDLLAFVNIKTFPACVAAWLIILIGIFTLFVCYIYKDEEINYINYLGIFLIMFGLWSWGEAKSYLFNYTDLFLQSQITILDMMIIPIPIMLFIRSSTYLPKRRKVIDGYIATCILSTIIGCLLALSNVVDLIEYIRIPQILLVIGVGLLCYMVVTTKQRRATDFVHTKLNRTALVILVVCTILEIIYLLSGNIFDFGITIRVGVILYIAIVYTIEILRVRDKRKYEVKENMEMKTELDKANIYLMSGKMTPHFIHNTLLAIQELCYSDPQEAANAIEIFSRYIRINLDGIGQHEVIPFEKELECIQLYMGIQQICYEDDVQFETDLQAKDFYIPPFCIQPIVENAVIHGIRKCRRQGCIRLKTWMEEECIVIQVEDNGAGFEVDEKKRTSFSSSISVVYRLEKVLNGKLDIMSKVGEGTIVTLRIPKQRRGDDGID